MTSPSRGSPRSSYWQLSRAPRYSITFALPLFVAYEALAALLAGSTGGIRNGADAILRSLFSLAAGANGPIVLTGVVIVAGLALVVRDLRRAPGRLQPAIFGRMLAESTVLALLFGVVVGTITAHLLGTLDLAARSGTGVAAAIQGAPTSIEESGVATRLMLSLGAGLYEELFFRVILVGALASAFRFLTGSQTIAGIGATLLGAFLFSAFHYIGPYGDPLELGSFTYRMIAGIAFSALYLLRGFGITAWTHALYDVYVLIL